MGRKKAAVPETTTPSNNVHPQAASMDISKENENLKRSQRTNRGKGGAIAQLENIGNAIHPGARKPAKNVVDSMPEELPKNPMAPIPVRRGRPKKSAPVPPQPPQPPTFLVPPGTEPSLNPPPNPVHRQAVASRFGFNSNVETGPENPSHNVIHPSNIDPSLLNIPGPLKPAQHRSLPHIQFGRSRNKQAKPRTFQPVIQQPEDSLDGNRDSQSEDDDNGDESEDSKDGDNDDHNDGDDNDSDNGGGGGHENHHGSDNDLQYDANTNYDVRNDLRTHDNDDRRDDYDYNYNDYANPNNSYQPEENDEIGGDKRRTQALQLQAKTKAGNKRKRLAPSISPLNESQGDGSFDVLEDHHRRNRAIRSPNPRYLESCAAKQVDQVSNPVEDDVSRKETDSEDEEPIAKRARRHSKIPYGSRHAKPTQLQFYPSQWADILDNAKKRFRLIIMLEILFPDMELDIKLATRCLLEALAEHVDGGGQVENGYYPEYENDMKRLIFDEGATFRGKLKRRARELICLQYNILPDLEELGSHHQEEYYDHVKRAVDKLLLKSAFLHNGKDASGRTNNFQHPALEALLADFLYGSNEGLARLFPKEFEDGIPDEAIAAGAAALKCALQEWRVGYHCNIDFTAKTYRKTYTGALSIIEETKADPYHGRKYEATRRRIANNGRMRAGREGIEEEDDDMGVVLD